MLFDDQIPFYKKWAIDFLLEIIYTENINKKQCRGHINKGGYDERDQQKSNE